MGRHMLHQSPVGFSVVPAPVCIELGAVVCNLLCPYVRGKQTNWRLFAPDLVPVGVRRSRGEEECHQAVVMSSLQAVFTVDVVFMKTLPEAETQSPDCGGEKSGFVSDTMVAVVYPSLATVKWNTVQWMGSPECCGPFPIERMWAGQEEPIPGVVWKKTAWQKQQEPRDHPSPQPCWWAVACLSSPCSELGSKDSAHIF